MAEGEVVCPVCGKRARWEDDPRGLFCSERCRLLDLSAWFGGNYRVPGEEADAADLETGRGEDDNPA